MADKYILLVEDNPDDEELTVMALREAGVANRIEVARDGAEAVEFAGRVQAAGDTPAAVVLLDLKLPKLDGFQVLDRIREMSAWARVPVVVMTSSSHDEDAVRAYDRGANSFVRKPVEFDVFREAARKVGMYWLLVNHPADHPGG